MEFSAFYARWRVKFAYNYNSICMNFKWGCIYKSTGFIRILQSNIFKIRIIVPACCTFVPIDTIGKHWNACIEKISYRKIAKACTFMKYNVCYCVYLFSSFSSTSFLSTTELPRRMFSMYYQEKCVVFFDQWPNG